MMLDFRSVGGDVMSMDTHPGDWRREEVPEDKSKETEKAVQELLEFVVRSSARFTLMLKTALDAGVPPNKAVTLLRTMGGSPFTAQQVENIIAEIVAHDRLIKRVD